MLMFTILKKGIVKKFQFKIKQNEMIDLLENVIKLFDKLIITGLNTNIFK